MFCAKCGKEIPDDAVFCVACGRPVNKESISAEKPEDSISAQRAITTSKSFTIGGIQIPKIVIWIVLVIIAILVLKSCFGGANKKTHVAMRMRQ